MGLSAAASYRSTGNASNIVARVADAAAQGATNWAQAVLDAALTIVPVDTGALRDSGHLETAADAGGITVGVAFETPYAVYVEFGTGIRGAASPGAGPGPYSPTWPGMAAQPYIRPAFDQHRTDAQPTIAAAVKSAL